MSFGQRVFGDYADTKRAKRTPDQWTAFWQTCVEHYFEAVGYDSLQPQGYEQNLQVASLGFGLAGYSNAKQRLVDWGYAADKVEAMPVGQVLSLYSARVNETVVDKAWKSFVVPYAAEAWRDTREAEAFLEANGAITGGKDRELLPISQLLIPVLGVARTAEVRVARELAALRVIEALRMHAARNNSRWPDSLDDVTCVPVPLNPATDKPFLFRRDGETAVLELPESEVPAGHSWRYEITIAKP
jgi:hypothetical protein